ncbi:MAG: OST-HTH/LOTUS domain-containing protein, partial [Myxococcales bacterium]|nr:OST-HTH/LOTUS domain-containing protein [Myxococcales bacterium]
VDGLFRERDDSLWGSMVKQTIKRKRPHFAETFHGYRNFTELLEDARDRGLLEIEKDRRSGGYLITAFGPKA